MLIGWESRKKKTDVPLFVCCTGVLTGTKHGVYNIVTRLKIKEAYVRISQTSSINSSLSKMKLLLFATIT